MIKGNKRRFEKDISLFLEEKPQDRILQCVAPLCAKQYGVLPISLSSDGNVLHVIARKETAVPTPFVLRGVLGKQIKIEGYAAFDVWDRAYKRFYGE